jgi:hypothetical protein
MRRESVRGYVGELRKWRFLTMAKVNNHCCLATFSITWAKRLKNLIAKKLRQLEIQKGGNASTF